MIDRTKIDNHLWKNDKKKVVHFNVVVNFLNHVTSTSGKPSLILKGGTALTIAYGSDRFSEDVDFDGIEADAEKYVKTFCERNGYWYRVAKNTDTVKRYLIHHDEELKPLKVEISYRIKNIDLNRIVNNNGVYTYALDDLFAMKMQAYSSRDKIRDLYDVVFIFKNHYDKISDIRIRDFVNALSYKGLDQFDYLIATQDDGLIDKNKLANDFLDMYDSLGLMNERKLEEESNATSLSDKQKQDKGYQR